MKMKSVLLTIFLVLFFAIGVTGGLVALDWSPPCWIADRLNYLSPRCAKDQIRSASGEKDLEVIDVAGIYAATDHEKRVEFRSRLKRPPNDDFANMVFVRSVRFRISGHRWRLVSSSLHW